MPRFSVFLFVAGPFSVGPDDPLFGGAYTHRVVFADNATQSKTIAVEVLRKDRQFALFRTSDGGSPVIRAEETRPVLWHEWLFSFRRPGFVFYDADELP